MKQLETIEKYLEGELTEAERSAFEQEIANDPELAEHIRLHQQLEHSLSNREEIEVEQQLESIIAAIDLEKEAPADESPTTSKSIPWGRILSLAAAVTVIAVGTWILLSSGPQSSKELYAMHYNAYDGSAELRSENGIPKSLLTEAFDTYNNREFTKAIGSFEEILELSPGNPRAHFYLAICFLETGKPDQAKTSLQVVIDEGQNLYLSQAHWYMGMACLQQEDTTCVKEQLKGLTEGAGRYRDQAKEVLDAL